ncbi:MAG: aldolase/citrate lyase family protein [Anaerolineae bacterium]|nr:aldolase/citrate lyase family protein [Anaerolineae bacterium]
MLRENRVKRALRRGESVFGTMLLEVRTPSVVQTLAAAGLDFVMIDLEHGAFGLETVADICQVARLAGIVPLVRVTDHGYPWLARPLDAGAMGLMVPRIESRAQVETLVRAVRYPPLGGRGCSVTPRQTEFERVPVQDWLSWANEETLFIAQIEEKAAVEEIDGILSVPGVDAALIGPNDLSISLGVPGQIDHPAMQEAMARVVEAAARHGVASGLHVGDLAVLRAWQARGMRLLMYSNDTGLLRQAAEQAVRTIRG